MNKVKSTYVIAEVGSVHDGSFGNACKLIDLASECKASAVKFQMHDPENETLYNAPRPKFFKTENRFEYFKRTSFTIEQIKKLKLIANKKKLDFIVSPFSIEAAKKLNSINIDGFKIASGELTNHPLLECIAKFKKKIFLSTGMSNWKEINEAFKILKKNDVTLMQCTSFYPTPLEKAGINIIPLMKKKFNVPVGFSDHTTGLIASLYAVSCGASIIEKHITFSRFMYGSDAFNALEPEEFKLFCNHLRDLDKLMNHSVNKDDLSQFLNIKKTFEKNIVAAKDIKKNSRLKFADLCFKKSKKGVSASNYKFFLNKKIRKDVKKNYIFLKKDIY
jgi:N,N'-diacetyllegionaminate synthase